MERLVQWVVANGGALPHARPSATAARQLEVAGDAPPGAAAIVLPQRLLLAAPRAMADEEYGAAFR